METLFIFAMFKRVIGPRFEVLFLEDVRQFLMGLDENVRSKILYNVDKAKILNDSSCSRS
jgi:hypothetical protein